MFLSHLQIFCINLDSVWTTLGVLRRFINQSMILKLANIFFYIWGALQLHLLYRYKFYRNNLAKFSNFNSTKKKIDDCGFFTQNLLFAFFWRDHRNSMWAQILMTPFPQTYELFKTISSPTLSKNNNMFCIVLLIKLPTWITMKLGQCSNIDNEKYLDNIYYRDYWFIEVRNILFPRNFITLK